MVQLWVYVGCDLCYPFSSICHLGCKRLTATIELCGGEENDDESLVGPERAISRPLSRWRKGRVGRAVNNSSEVRPYTFDQFRPLIGKRHDPRLITLSMRATQDQTSLKKTGETGRAFGKLFSCKNESLDADEWMSKREVSGELLRMARVRFDFVYLVLPTFLS